MVAVRRRRFLISVEPWTGCVRPPGAVCVMLWSLERHTRLLEAHQLQDDAALAEWLTGVVTRCGRENVAIDWTDTLRERRKLALLVAQCLDVPVPRSA
jgi:hypothetical protein